MTEGGEDSHNKIIRKKVSRAMERLKGKKASEENDKRKRL